MKDAKYIAFIEGDKITLNRKLPVDQAEDEG